MGRRRAALSDAWWLTVGVGHGFGTVVRDTCDGWVAMAPAFSIEHFAHFPVPRCDKITNACRI
jgi:hypothetical protein